MWRKTVLDNGIRVVTDEMPWAKSVSVGFWIGSGSRDERPGEAGYAHLVEHMLFKGTRTRSARDIAEAMDRTGGHMNAFTTKETTCYHARVPYSYGPFALELLSDMVMHSTFSPEDLVREQAVILEEINQVEDTPEDLVHELFDRQLFGGHPLAHPVLGTPTGVAGAGRDDVLTFVHRHYRPDNLVIAVAGNVRHDEVVDVAHRVIGRWEGAEGDGGVRPARTSVALQYRPERSYIEREGEQVHLVVGVPGLSRRDSDRYALDLLDAIVGGGMSSRLFQQLREEKGLVYSTYSFHANYSDAGVFGGYAAAGPDRAEDVLAEMLVALQTVRAGDIRVEEVNRVKEHVKGSLLLGWENTGTRMGMLAGAELAQEPYLDVEELSARYEEVDEEQVRGLAARLLAPEAISIVGLGPGHQAFASRQMVEATG